MTATLLSGCGGSGGNAAGGSMNDPGKSGTPAASGSDANGAKSSGADTDNAKGTDADANDAKSSDAGVDTNGSTAAANTTKTDETLTIVLPGEPDSLIVESTAGSNSTPVRMLIGDRLLDYNDATGEFTGVLLESWEIVDENHLRGHVRKGIKAPDETEFNANDILFSLKKAAELAPVFMVSSLVVDNCKVEDDYTILFETSGTVLSAMGMMATGVNSIYDESSFEACGGEAGARTNPLWGIGKYKFSEWVPGQYILLERNEDYWDSSYVGYYKNIKFTFVSDSATRVMSIMSGTANVAPNVALGSVVEYMDSSECDVIVLEGGQAAGLQLNCSGDGPLSDVKVREAIRCAINVDALNMVSSSGYANREDHYILTSSPYYFDPTGGAGITYDVEKAKGLLEEAGYGNGFEITLLGGAGEEELLTAIQSMLSEIGIKVEISMPDTSVMVSMGQSGDYDIFYGSHPAALKYRNIDVFKQLEPNTAGKGEYMGGPKLLDPELQKLIDSAVGDADETAAADSVNKIIQYVYDNVCYIGVNGSVTASVVTEGLTGVALDVGSCIDLSGIHPAAN